MNRVRAGFFSLSEPSPTGDDRSYLAWHLLDHMPEQYQLPGMVHAQRWVSTPACRRARAAGTDGWEDVDHVVCYLMGEPVQETLDQFSALGRRLAQLGRYPVALPSRFRAALALVETRAAPRVVVSPEVVPFRPHLGTYIVVEAPGPAATPDRPVDGRAELVAVDGVAGAWVFASAEALRRPAFDADDVVVTVCFLDADPAEVADDIRPVLHRAWERSPTRPLLAAPFESLTRWDGLWGPAGGGR